MTNRNNKSNATVGASGDDLTQITTIFRKHLRDTESLMLTARTLCEISFEEIDRLGEVSSDKPILDAVLRLDALLKSICSSVVQMEKSIEDVAHEMHSVGAA